MGWIEYVETNWKLLSLRFNVVWSDPRYTRFPRYMYNRISLWKKHGRVRLYVPETLYTGAGYIDLIERKMYIRPDVNETGRARITELFNLIQSSCDGENLSDHREGV